ncbi:MAG: hypothetical protein ABIH26_09960, partial [Candidatus Eisenbacteria bacterium]
MRSSRNLGPVRIVPAAIAVFLLVRLLGCLDADPLGTGAGGARLAVQISSWGSGSPAKAAAPDSLRVHLYDVTGSRYTDHPERFPLAAEATAHRSREDATGRYLLCEHQVDLLEEREFRIVVRFSYDAGSMREAVAGERTITLRPGDRK